MRVLALADTHLGLRLGRTSQARQDMANHAYQQFQYCIQEAIRQNVDYIIHAGDVFNRSQPPKWIQEHYYQAIQPALNQGIEMMIIPGNHDRARLESSLFDYMYPNYHVFNSLDYIDQDGIRWIGLPFVYRDYRERYRQIRTWIDRSKIPVIVICHQLFEGATYGPHQYSFTSREDVFNTSDLPAHAQFITGHIHRAQYLDNGKVVYTGSTVRTSFAELIEPKGYLLLDIDQDTIEISFHQIPSQSMEVIEIDCRKLDLEQLDTSLEKYQNNTRLLLRLLHNKVDQHLRSKLYQRYPSDKWPYLTISPARSDTILRAQYGLFQKKFELKPTRRNWTTRLQTQISKYRE